MKILHILKHVRRGNGHVHVAVDLACTQANSGHRVMVASSGGTYSTLLTDHGVEVANIPESGGLRGAADTARSVLAHARTFRPDVIHAHMMTSAVLGLAASKIVNTPLVTTMHNSFERHSVLMRLGKIVVAVSEAERQLLLSRGYPRDKVVTILNGPNGSPRESTDASDVDSLAQPSIVTLSGLHQRKGIVDVITAFAEINSEFPHWHLNIIGSGPDREHLISAIEEFGLDGSIHLVGSSLTPRFLLQQAEIFASGSLAEPFGLAVAEARAAGCAIVATAVGGVPEVVEHGRAGQLTPVSDPSAMASVFRSLMGDQRALTTWRERAVQGVEFFTVGRMTTDYTRVYESAVARR